ncbi:MAG: modified peptide precursor CbpA [Sulfuricella sp.]|nr:modified peptide precursor CbpA [Betaproteobacteria bacterium]
MQQTKPGQHQQTATAAPKAPVPVIAVRKSCNPEGVGLSHYVLMDRKKAK